MAIVIAIISVIIAGGAVTFSASVQQKQFDQTKEKLATLQKALRDYWLTFGRLPCPANVEEYSLADSNFGKEAANKGSCDGTPSANWLYNLDVPDNITVCDYSGPADKDNCVYGGMIPTRTLQLPDDYAFDGWGRRLTYVVHSDFTRAEALNTLDKVTSDIDNSVTRIIVKSAAGDNKTAAAAYALLSHGVNGHGAFPRYSTDGTLRVKSGSLNTLEQENCDCDDDAVLLGSGFDNVFYQAPYSTSTTATTNTFDDILVFATRGNLASAKE